MQQVFFGLGNLSMATSLNNDKCTGGPLTAVTEGNVAAVERLIGEDLWLTSGNLELALKISLPSLRMIHHNRLCPRNVSTHWGPHNLMEMQMPAQVEGCSWMPHRFQIDIF